MMVGMKEKIVILLIWTWNGYLALNCRIHLQLKNIVKRIFSLIPLILRNTGSLMIWVYKQERLFVSRDSRH